MLLVRTTGSRIIIKPISAESTKKIDAIFALNIGGIANLTILPAKNTQPGYRGLIPSASAIPCSTPGANKLAALGQAFDNKG